jgi:hypothetical protein
MRMPSYGPSNQLRTSRLPPAKRNADKKERQWKLCLHLLAVQKEQEKLGRPRRSTCLQVKALNNQWTKNGWPADFPYAIAVLIKHLVDTFDLMFPWLTIDMAWLLLKSEPGDGFQVWHQDMKLGARITRTIVVNIYSNKVDKVMFAAPLVKTANQALGINEVECGGEREIKSSEGNPRREDNQAQQNPRREECQVVDARNNDMESKYDSDNDTLFPENDVDEIDSCKGHFCTICQQTCFLHEKDLATFGRCPHVHCYECIENWKDELKRKHMYCDVCRKQISTIITHTRVSSHEMECTVCEEISKKGEEEVAKQREEVAKQREKRELEHRRWLAKWCDWDEGATLHGNCIEHGERCHCEFTRERMKECTHEGCMTKTQKICQDWWLEQHCYQVNDEDLCFCREHNECYQKWVKYKANLLT